MLGSWFSSKDHDKAQETAQTTDLQRISTNTTNVDDSAKLTPKTSPIGFTSPHDAILAQMRGLPLVEDSEDGLLRDVAPSIQKPGFPEGPSPTNSMVNDPNTRKELLCDPFDGAPLGLVVASPSGQRFPQTVYPSSAGATPMRIDGENKGEQWVHLSRVLDLQNELAKMHLEMEGVGTSDGKGKGVGKGRIRSKGKGESGMWEGRARDVKPRRRTTTETIPQTPHEGDVEGVDAAGDEEIETKKAREDQFASLADQFEGRKDAIQEIMNKLDHLSKALTEFHTLQAPTFEFSKTNSRQNSTTPDMTPPQVYPKVTSYRPTTLPNSGLSTSPNPQHLQAILPSVRDSPSSISIPPLEFTSQRDVDIIPLSLCRLAEPRKAESDQASLVINVLEPGKQTHVMDSPDDMSGHVKLPPGF